MTERQREFIRALRILGWGAVVVALMLNTMSPPVEVWQILSSTS